MSSPRLVVGRRSMPGAFYVVTTITSQRMPWLTEAATVAAIRAELLACERAGWLVSDAWVVMPDHLHWLFQLRHPSLARVIQTFKSRSARGIRACIGGGGPVWQAGYYDHCVRSDEDLQAQAHYIIANPLRAGLVERVEDHPYWWSRHVGPPL